jgi:SAM-dependent methyltransferase
LDTDRTKESTIRFDSEIGWQEKDLSGKTVVEFGSGAGRFVDTVSRRGAKLVVGLDATDAVDAAQDNLADRENILFVQGDIFCSPFRNACFDFGYSIGVLHHTPDPEESFRILTKVIKAPGNIGLSLYDISLYARPNRNSLKVATIELFWALNMWRCEMFRSVTTRLPGNVFLTYCKTVVPALHFLNKIPVLRYLRYLLPSTCYRHLPVIWSMVDTHDTYATKIVHQYRGKDVFQWFLREGMSNIVLRNSRAGWVSITGVVDEEEVRNRQRVFLEQPAAPGLQG